VTRQDLPRTSDTSAPIVGIDGTSLAPAAADLSASGLLICGPYRSGRTTVLATLARSLREACPRLELRLLAPRRSALTALSAVFTSVARGGEQCEKAIRDVHVSVLSRSSEAEHPLLVVVVDDIGELADGPAALPLEEIARRGRDVNVRVIAACEVGQARSYSPLLRELRRDGNGLLLEPDLDADGDVLGVRLPRHSAVPFVPGRGFLVSRGRPALVQVATDG
jgi:S-DNA-T family DNA segregation ATPase FtsK/SpoIIIE